MIPGFQPFLRGEVEPLWFVGEQVIDLKLDGSKTGGAFLLLEVITGPGGGAPQPHVHTREDETLILLEGEVTVAIGNEERTVLPGDVVFFPRGVPHSFTNTGRATSRGIGVVSPAGLEDFFRELGVPKTGAKRPPGYTGPDDGAFQTAADRAGMRLLPG